MKYIKYTKYLINHIWFVRKACWAKGLYWQGLKHDWSKWLPVEFIPYANFFYGYDTILNPDWTDGFTGMTTDTPKYIKVKRGKRDNTGYYKPTDTGDDKFEWAWFHHIKFNKHHWQYWSYAGDSGEIILKPMPQKFRLEMLCDWWGASMAQGYGGKCKTWYEANKNKMQLAPETRKWVEANVSDSFI